MSAPFSISSQTRIAIIGAEGQLGRQFATATPGILFPLNRQKADLLQPATLLQTLEEIKPDLIINCAAYNLVDKAESEPEPCLQINTTGVFHLARISKQLGATLVHFTTDHLFGASPKLDKMGNPVPWVETDAPSPIGVYSASKAAGEDLAIGSGASVYIIRTCGLYGIPGTGGKGTNFIEAILRAVANKRQLRVVCDQYCTPTSVTTLQPAVLELLAHYPPGIYHLTDQGSVTWCEFARAIVETAGLGVEVTPIGTHEWPAAAKRPFFSVLGSVHRGQPHYPKLAPWQESLKQYLANRPKGSA